MPIYTIHDPQDTNKKQNVIAVEYRVLEPRRTNMQKVIEAIPPKWLVPSFGKIGDESETQTPKYSLRFGTALFNKEAIHLYIKDPRTNEMYPDGVVEAADFSWRDAIQTQASSMNQAIIEWDLGDLTNIKHGEELRHTLANAVDSGRQIEANHWFASIKMGIPRIREHPGEEIVRIHYMPFLKDKMSAHIGIVVPYNAGNVDIIRKDMTLFLRTAQGTVEPMNRHTQNPDNEIEQLETLERRLV